MSLSCTNTFQKAAKITVHFKKTKVFLFFKSTVHSRKKKLLLLFISVTLTLVRSIFHAPQSQSYQTYWRDSLFRAGSL